MRGVCRIGTSGWSYPDWEGRFYPAGLPSRHRLEFYYVRLRGVTQAYDYGVQELSKLAERLTAGCSGGLDAYVYFDNDVQARAIGNARGLREMIR